VQRRAVSILKIYPILKLELLDPMQIHYENSLLSKIGASAWGLKKVKNLSTSGTKPKIGTILEMVRLLL